MEPNIQNIRFPKQSIDAITSDGAAEGKSTTVFFSLTSLKEKKPNIEKIRFPDQGIGAITSDDAAEGKSTTSSFSMTSLKGKKPNIDKIRFSEPQGTGAITAKSGPESKSVSSPLVAVSKPVSRTTIIEDILSRNNKMNLLIDLLKYMVHINSDFFQIFVTPNDEHSYVPTAYNEDWPRNLSFSQMISAYERGYKLAQENYTLAINKDEGHSKDYGFPLSHFENYGFPHPFIFKLRNFPAS